MTLQTQVVVLRQQGKTYGEIQQVLKQKIAKSTLSYWCRNVPLPAGYTDKVTKLIGEGCSRGRAIALLKKQEIRTQNNIDIYRKYEPLKVFMKDKRTALIALTMLCLGEASKTSDTLWLGSSDERIIRLFLGLLKQCVEFDLEKVRCTLQCRDDQDIPQLEAYWSKISGIPRRLFYKARVDNRTIGKPTLHHEYKGVLRVDYLNSQIQKELNVLYNLLVECV